MTPTTSSDIQLYLTIQGFCPILPDTLSHHSHARLIMYIKNTVSSIVTRLSQHLRELPLVTLEVLGLAISQLAKCDPHQPGTRKARVYKNTSQEGFCLDRLQSDVNSMVSKETDLDKADAVYSSELQYAARKWAPFRTIQI